MRQNVLVETEGEATLTNDEGTEPATSNYLRGYLLDQVKRDRYGSIRCIVYSVIDPGFDENVRCDGISVQPGGWS